MEQRQGQIQNPGSRGWKDFPHWSRLCVAARLVAIALWAVWFGSPAFGSSSYDFTYEGRITDKAGKPFQGTYALQIDFFHDEEGGDPVLTVTDGLDAVPLSAGGMFQVTVSLTNDEFAKVFPDVSQTVYVAFTDLSHRASQPLPRQRVMMLPYAGKVPVDGKTVRFGADGRLTVGPRTRPKSWEFLTMDGNGQFAWAVPWTTVGTFAGGGGSFNVDLASGRVGIGTTSQLAKLAVTGSTYVNADNAAIVADSGASRLGFVKKYGSAPVLASGSSTDITFATSNVANLLDSSIGDQTLTPRMTIKSNGNVGIGTTAPASRLTVGGETGQFPTSLIVLPTTHTTSRRSALGLDNWLLLQDSMGNGTKDFSIYDSAGAGSRLYINTSGNVGIGTTSPTEKLHVAGSLRVQGSTDCILGGGSGSTNCTSDLRLKDNVVPIAESLDKISKLRGVEFDWNNLALSPGIHSIGVIAQDVERVFPTAVITNPDTGYKMVDYAVLVAPLIEAVKTLSAENAAIKAENKQIKAENQALMDNTLEINHKLNQLMQSVCQMNGRFDFCGR